VNDQMKVCINTYHCLTYHINRNCWRSMQKPVRVGSKAEVSMFSITLKDSQLNVITESSPMEYGRVTI